VAGSGRLYSKRIIVDVVIFCALAFGLTWLLLSLYILDAAAASRYLGPMKVGAPAFFVAVYAPTLAAIAVTAWRYGRAGLANLFRSFVRFRVKWYWIAISLLGYPLLWLVVEIVSSATSGELVSFSFDPWLVALPAVILGGHLLSDPGALGEELGWRGFMLPRLLELMDARAAALLVGLVWTAWHLPAFYVETLSQSRVGLGIFTLNVLAFSVLMTWIFVNTRGSVLWAGVVPHMLFNAVGPAGITPVLWVTILVAIVLLVLGGKHLRGLGNPKAQLPQAEFLANSERERT
tara:strand:+ start:299 stop:1171 length:873 start_codon:yes stop_codon:yes gene_type:complete